MFRLSIRELLLLTVIAAVALGWWVDRTRLERRNRGLEADLHRLHQRTRLVLP